MSCTYYTHRVRLDVNNMLICYVVFDFYVTHCTAYFGKVRSPVQRLFTDGYICILFVCELLHDNLNSLLCKVFLNGVMPLIRTVYLHYVRMWSVHAITGFSSYVPTRWGEVPFRALRKLWIINIQKRWTYIKLVWPCTRCESYACYFRKLYYGILSVMYVGCKLPFNLFMLLVYPTGKERYRAHTV